MRTTGVVTMKTLVLVVLLAVAEVSTGRQPKAFAANLALGRPYTVSISADATYPDEGHRELTDGKKGIVSYLDRAWSGYHVSAGQTMDIVVDLGQVKAIDSVTIDMLLHPAAGIMQPMYVAAGVSQDNKSWALWGVLYPPALAPGQSATPQRVTYTLPASARERVAARYVRVHLPLEISLFIDEVEVNGADGGDGASSQASSSLAQLPPWPQGDQFDLAPIGPYRTPGKATGGVRDIILLPLYPPLPWDMQQLLPYITFGKPAAEQAVSDNPEEPGWEPQDWFFDTVLFAPVAAAPSGRLFHSAGSPAAVFEDWLWLLNTYFAADGPLASLEKSTAWAGRRLDDAGHKVKVLLALPSPSPKQSEFWSGIEKDPQAKQYFESKGLAVSANRFSGTLQERRTVLEWMIDEILRRWHQAGFHQLELAGFYWFEEEVSDKADDRALVKQVAQMIHARGSLFFWIPYFRASGSTAWREWGFDAAMLQPNYYFMPRDQVPPLGSPPEQRLARLRQAAMLARRYEMGIEIEFDASVIGDAEMRQRLYEYLEAGDQYGYMREAVLGYYQNVNDLAQMARMAGGPGRRVYEDLYRFVRGQSVSWGLSGRVLSRSGEPVAGARVQFGEVATHSDESGRFVLSGLLGDQGTVAVSAPSGQAAFVPLVREAAPPVLDVSVEQLPEKPLLDPAALAPGQDSTRWPGLQILGCPAEVISEGQSEPVTVNRELKLTLGQSPFPFGSVSFDLPEGSKEQDWSNWQALAIDLRWEKVPASPVALTVTIRDNDGNAYARTLPVMPEDPVQQSLLVPLADAATGRFATAIPGNEEGEGVNLKQIARVTVAVPQVDGQEEVLYLGKWYLIGSAGTAPAS
ncbi:MAG: DUF4855 domain-containing protein [Limnochordaceae bacterium]|nr:DUF4855 domain-containing protein [Limnochordaceae bacterium]